MARGRPSKKAHIIDAACGLFTKQGYQSTSIDQVVVTAAVSKPTVYSNFPTKLVLWENVIESLIERAKDDMETTLSSLQSALKTPDNTTLISGWITLWQTWVKKQERLAVYRVLLGEQHKMATSTVALFDQFETVLESALQAWLSGFDVIESSLFTLKAVTKEALLMPALLHQKPMDSIELMKQLELLTRNNKIK
ncbi:TetR family transcriptional regulator [Marinomonas ushuaiensis DSM 15871]|uniref:TetR family transcriptional regulator n=1 Tax=Marinomonas ushuaiensis DSM 15871 TaxID=1122207 RepID=X7E6A0_9GAMM|nr:TetR/AcrR family transcriptional regulator [Marinomonas ushuaiensis]ETX11365.1 TetR family transcriptional regulator [Marinomonas ushuaiensis DSM 15871]